MSELSGLDLRGAVFRDIDFTGARVADSVLEDVDIWVWGPDLTPAMAGLRINGIDIAPLVEAELDGRHPERRHLQGIETADQLRAAWPHVEAMWAPTLEWARGLPEAVLHERVDREFSFLETLRHLVFATDAWVRRVALGQDPAFHAIARAFPYDSGTWSADGTVPWAVAGIDIHAHPGLDEVVAAREENWALIRDTLAELDDDRLQETRTAPQTPGYPAGTEERTVLRCFRSIVNEEWWHHQYAVRDLDVLTA